MHKNTERPKQDKITQRLIYSAICQAAFVHAHMFRTRAVGSGPSHNYSSIVCSQPFFNAHLTVAAIIPRRLAGNRPGLCCNVAILSQFTPLLTTDGARLVQNSFASVEEKGEPRRTVLRRDLLGVISDTHTQTHHVCKLTGLAQQCSWETFLLIDIAPAALHRPASIVEVRTGWDSFRMSAREAANAQMVRSCRNALATFSKCVTFTRCTFVRVEDGWTWPSWLSCVGDRPAICRGTFSTSGSKAVKLHFELKRFESVSEFVFRLESLS